MKKSMIRQGCFLLIALFATLSSFSQMTVVRGKVTAFHEFSLQYIVVRAKNSNTATRTDENGYYEIVCAVKDVITFESPAFVKVKKKVNAPVDSLNVNMIFINTPAKKEYAIGYGVISEENLTYAVDHLSNENFNYESYSNIYDLLVGRFPGVQVSNDEIIIRGRSTIVGSDAALLVVDGVVVNDISYVHPSQVKSVDVLKGSAATIYGSRGANGVVIITLKK